MKGNHSMKMNGSFEIISMKFKEGVSFTTQKEYMSQLNTIAAGFEGFKQRDCYYSYENSRWIDFIVWVDKDHAKRASQSIMKDPVALKIFSEIDEKSMIFSHYEKVIGAR